MTENQTVKLKAIKNRATRYELVLSSEGSHQKLRLCYTGRKNRSGLMAAIRANGPELVKLTGASDFQLSKGPAATLGSWRLAFSGRTQREAIIAGELPWFAAEAE